MTDKEKFQLRIQSLTLAGLGLLLADLQRRLVDQGEAEGEFYSITTNIVGHISNIGKALEDIINES